MRNETLREIFGNKETCARILCDIQHYWGDIKADPEDLLAAKHALEIMLLFGDEEMMFAYEAANTEFDFRMVASGLLE